MGNYSLVINSKFQPFSFERYILPYQLYNEAYKEVDNALGELDTKASIWENMANELTDPVAYKQYKDYANELRNKRDLLYKEGLNASSRRGLLDMRARYSLEITPIELAYLNRAKEIEELRAGKAKGMVYEGDASVTSLDRYLKNPAIRYGMANSEEGFKRVATAATALSKKLRDNYGRGKALDAYTKTWLLEHGYRDTEVALAIADIQGALQGDGNVRGTNILTSILANEMLTSGVNAWENQDARMDYYNRIAPALYQAVGLTLVGTYLDLGAIMAALLAKEKELARYKKTLEDEENNKPTVKFNPRITEGIDSDKNNEFSKTEDRLKGFRRAGTLSFTTDALHNKSITVKKLENSLKKYSSELLKLFRLHESNIGKSRATISSGLGSYGAIGQAMSKNVGVPKGYSEWKELNKQLELAKKDLEDERKFVGRIAGKYRHLGNNTFENVRRGMALEKLQRAEEVSSFALDANPSDYKNTIDRIGNWLMSFNAKTLDNKTNVGLKDEDGKFMDYEDTRDLFYDSNGNVRNIKIKIKGGKNPHLSLISPEGKEYTVHGILQIDKYNKDLSSVQGFLRNFDFESVGRDRILASPQAIKTIYSGDSDTLNKINYKPIKGTNYYGATIYEPNSGEYIKIMVDRSGNLIGINSLSEEFLGASNRDAYFMNMANRGLQDLIIPASK